MKLLAKAIQFPATVDDVAIAEFQEQAKSAIASDTTVIIINCANVEFMSSPGLMALVVVLKRVRESGKKLLLCSINEQVRMLLELTGMEQVFEIVESSIVEVERLELALK